MAVQRGPPGRTRERAALCVLLDEIQVAGS